MIINYGFVIENFGIWKCIYILRHISKEWDYKFINIIHQMIRELLYIKSPHWIFFFIVLQRYVYIIIFIFTWMNYFLFSISKKKKLKMYIFNFQDLILRTIYIRILSIRHLWKIFNFFFHFVKKIKYNLFFQHKRSG